MLAYKYCTIKKKLLHVAIHVERRYLHGLPRTLSWLPARVSHAPSCPMCFQCPSLHWSHLPLIQEPRAPSLFFPKQFPGHKAVNESVFSNVQLPEYASILFTCLVQGILRISLTCSTRFFRDNCHRLTKGRWGGGGGWGKDTTEDIRERYRTGRCSQNYPDLTTEYDIMQALGRSKNNTSGPKGVQY